MEQVFLVVCLFLACCVVQLMAGLSVSSAGKKAALVWNLPWFLSSLWPMGGGRVTCDGLHPVQGRVAILLVTSCNRNWDKYGLDGPLNPLTPKI